MTSWSVRHDCRSTVPLESICVYCSMARLWSAVDLPEASSMSLNPRPMVVADPRSPVRGAICCTMLVMESSEVGSPCIFSLMRSIDVDASEAL